MLKALMRDQYGASDSEELLRVQEELRELKKQFGVDQNKGSGMHRGFPGM